ncbi:MAG: diaminopimelate epimerase [Candidatus Solibacter usitatus]|nr:diaminopimelate epimerase [Candidatus Solibacter usitatus]
MRIPFTKAHGARNDFVLTWKNEAPDADLRAAARAICDRNTGVGADGWILVTRMQGDTNGSIQLYNSDGSDSEISGNGTRCAAALLLEDGVSAEEVRIATGAGVKHIRVLSRNGTHFNFEMNMGPASVADGDLRTQVDELREATIVNVGNPQCALFVDDFDFDWREAGKRVEWHSRFPHRTNVSFVQVVDRHNLNVRFWERGAGETQSSGTGSTGAAAAAVLRGLAESPITVHTAAGPLGIRLDKGNYYLTGPAEITVRGEFYYV